jgi:DNA-binding NarL/FixJ family response regulator
MLFLEHMSYTASQRITVPNLKTVFIIIVLLFIMVFNTLDLINDFAEQESLWHLIEEMIVIFMAFSLIAYLVIDVRLQKRNLELLRQELKSTEYSLEKSHAVIQNARKNYSEVIQQQFIDWQLSHGQQEIALLLLKGLTFNEIAAIRETKEKTVRQQASEIYKKAGVSGRHAFSAWFFEDFL